METETEKINQVLTFISANSIGELNQLIYGRVKLAYEKIGAHPGFDFFFVLKSTKKNSNLDGKFVCERR